MERLKPRTVAIIGAGSWGTAVAIHLAACGYEVLLWSHNKQHAADMAAHRCNEKYLPGAPFPASLQIDTSLNHCIKQADNVIVAVPSHAFSTLLTQMDKPRHGLAWLTKGLDPDSHCFLSQLVAQRWGEHYPVAIISGPSFAKEVARGLPTAIALAGNDEHFVKSIQKLLHHKNLRVYFSDDMAGIQLCGAIKNVLAIACGISDGLGYGANARAALITRGLAEMTRLGVALGAREESFIGLAGMGDLVLTCTDDQSRNRRFGLKLGEGLSQEQAQEQIAQVVEGKHNAHQVCSLARSAGIEMPICFQVEALLQDDITPEQAVHNLMKRSAKKE